MLDLLLPTDDRSVLMQFAVVAIVGVAVLFAVRRNRDLLIFSAGATLLVLALMAIRAVH